MLGDRLVAAATAARNAHTVDEVVRLTLRTHAAHNGSRSGFRQTSDLERSPVSEFQDKLDRGSARAGGHEIVVKVRHAVRRS
jgi:hypothetical protein